MMRKGKSKTIKKDYFSIAFIPHSSDDVKVFKVTGFRAKLLSIGLLAVTLVICAGIFLSFTLRENNLLRTNLEKLRDNNIEQNELISEKAGEIEKLRENEKVYASKITECINKYKEITNKYLTGRVNGDITSRSGDRTEKDFIEELKALKDLLEDFNELNKSGTIDTVDLSGTEAKLKAYMETIPTLWPASGEINDNFGYRKDPFTRRRTFHEGIDIGADYGVSIKAAASGKVIFAGYKSGYGRMVIIDHGKGISTAYGHASKLLVKEGQKVKKGEKIAKVGSSGRSTGPHVHFEVRLYGTQIDPLKYLD